MEQRNFFIILTALAVFTLAVLLGYVAFHIAFDVGMNK